MTSAADSHNSASTFRTPTTMQKWGKEYAERFMRPCMSVDFPTLLDLRTGVLDRAKISLAALDNSELYEPQVVYYLLQYVRRANMGKLKDIGYTSQRLIKFLDPSHDCIVRDQALWIIANEIYCLGGNRESMRQLGVIPKMISIFAEPNCADCIREKCLIALTNYAIDATETLREVTDSRFCADFLVCFLRPGGISEYMYRPCIYVLRKLIMDHNALPLSEKDKWRVADTVVRYMPEVTADSSDSRRQKIEESLGHAFASLASLLKGKPDLQNHVIAGMNIESVLGWIDYCKLGGKWPGKLVYSLLQLIGYVAKDSRGSVAIDILLEHKLVERLLALYGTPSEGRLEITESTVCILADLANTEKKQQLQRIIDAGTIQVLGEMLNGTERHVKIGDVIRNAMMNATEEQVSQMLNRGGDRILIQLVGRKIAGYAVRTDIKPAISALEGMSAALSACKEAAGKLEGCMEVVKKLKKVKDQRIKLLACEVVAKFDSLQEMSDDK